MKFAVVCTALLVAVASASASAADTDVNVNVVGARSPMLRATTDSDSGVSVSIASKTALDRATGLLNKNTVAADNNVLVAKSNAVFTQNDRLAMREKVLDVVQTEQPMAAATLTKDVMRAVSASDKDTALMTKASAVVASTGDPSALAQRIADFVDAVADKEMEQVQEQSIQSQVPRGVMVRIGTKDILRQPTGVVNKNVAASDNQITVSNSRIMPTQNDQIVLTGGAKVADAILPAAAVNVGQVTMAGDADSEDSKEEEASEPMYRQAFVYKKDGEADANKEQWGMWGAGWRYPLGYWNTFGAGLWGGGCGLGFALGPWYYC